MGIEIERRFLVTSNEWKKYTKKKEKLLQGYLSSDINSWTIRIRVHENGNSYITLKSKLSENVMHEFEYLIPNQDAQLILSLVSKKVEKTRFTLNLGQGNWIVDCFEAENHPLVIAEVELNNIDDSIDLPSWCGREITGQNQLSNAALANRPISEFSIKSRLTSKQARIT